MKKLEDFNCDKIDFRSQHHNFGGLSTTQCCDEIRTEASQCGDTKRIWHNEDGTVCCQEIEDICCPDA
jgi:hypothetical protein